jgi:hypothetical protein
MSEPTVIIIVKEPEEKTFAENVTEGVTETASNIAGCIGSVFTPSFWGIGSKDEE